MYKKNAFFEQNCTKKMHKHPLLHDTTKQQLFSITKGTHARSARHRALLRPSAPLHPQKRPRPPQQRHERPQPPLRHSLIGSINRELNWELKGTNVLIA